jgi:hypothetical protein
MSATEACAESGRVCTTKVYVASGGVYKLGPELHLEVSNPQGPVPTYCHLLRFEYNFLIIERVRFDSKIIFFLSNVFASLRKEFSFC